MLLSAAPRRSSSFVTIATRRSPLHGCTSPTLVSFTGLSTTGSRRSSSSLPSSSKKRDYRGPLLVGGSLVGASTIQYYLHHRALSTPATVLPSSAATTASSLSPTSNNTSSSDIALAPTGLKAAFSTSAGPPSPETVVVQAPSVASSSPKKPAAAAAAEGDHDSDSPISGLKITLYQYQICPFCCKVKAVLDYFKVPYETLDVNPLTKAEIKFSPDYRKVPIARIGGEVVRDSSVIVSKISTLLRDAHAAPTKELDQFFSPEATRWAEWADMELAVLLFPNITRTFDEAYQAFSYVKNVPHFSLLDKYSNLWIGSTAMWAAQGKLKKKYNITDERAALFLALKDWTTEVGDKPFLSGNQPNLGDLCVYACIRAIEGLDAHKEIMEVDAVASWYYRVEHAIGASACVKAE